MIASFFQFREDTKDLESEVDQKMEGLKERLRKKKCPRECIPLGEDFPSAFLKQAEKLAIGTVQWNSFGASASGGLFVARCEMEQGAAIQKHAHPSFDQFLYPVAGKLINWQDECYDGDILVPPEKVEEETAMIPESNVEGFHLVSSGERHWIQAVEKTTFVTKYVYND